MTWKYVLPLIALLGCDYRPTEYRMISSECINQECAPIQARGYFKQGDSYPHTIMLTSDGCRADAYDNDSDGTIERIIIDKSNTCSAEDAKERIQRATNLLRNTSAVSVATK